MDSNEKRVCVSLWENMNPELLSLIFTDIPSDFLCRTIPFVCKSWREAAAEPYFWSDVELEEWCRRVNRSDVIDFAVRKLVRRSRGTLVRLSAYRIGYSGFASACFGKFLRVLQIPMSEITDEMVQKHAESLPKLAILDISYCVRITFKGIEILGKHCKNLVQLKRNIPPPAFEVCADNGVAAKVDELEALAVANTMRGLKHLELAYGRFSDHGLDAILSNCLGLSNLDIRGCWNVRLDGDIEKKCDLIKSFKDPWQDDYENMNSSGDEVDNANGDDGSDGGGDADVVIVDTDEDVGDADIDEDGSADNKGIAVVVISDDSDDY